MKLVIDTENRIVSYASVGDMANAIDFEGEVPPDFEFNFLPGKYLLKNNEIKIDDQFENDSYIVTPTKEQQIIMQQANNITALKQMVMSQASQIAALTKGDK